MVKTCEIYYYCDVQKCNCGQIKSWNITDYETGIYRKNSVIGDATHNAVIRRIQLAVLD